MLFISLQLSSRFLLVLNHLNVKYIQPCGKPTVSFIQAVAPFLFFFLPTVLPLQSLMQAAVESTVAATEGWHLFYGRCP